MTLVPKLSTTTDAYICGDIDKTPVYFLTYYTTDSMRNGVEMPTGELWSRAGGQWVRGKDL